MATRRMATKRFTLGWDDPDEAEAVADLFYDAAHKRGELVDHGFWDDYNELRRQIDAAKVEDAIDWAGV